MLSVGQPASARRSRRHARKDFGRRLLVVVLRLFGQLDHMDAATWEKIKDHPCYSEEAHHYFARMHVAVAPACNIQCNYCNRKYDCANSNT